jgi:hypothetical protein
LPDQSDDDRKQTMQLSHGEIVMTTRLTAATNDKALDAFIAAKTEIDAMLERLKVLSDDHFNTDPDEIHWGHVGTLNHCRARLREITDMAFAEGEHSA